MQNRNNLTCITRNTESCWPNKDVYCRWKSWWKLFIVEELHVDFSRRLCSFLPRQTNLIEHFIAPGCLRTCWKVYGLSLQKNCVLSVPKCIVHSCTVAAAEEVQGSREYIEGELDIWLLKWYGVLLETVKGCELNVIATEGYLWVQHNSN